MVEVELDVMDQIAQLFEKQKHINDVSLGFVRLLYCESLRNKSNANELCVEELTKIVQSRDATIQERDIAIQKLQQD